MVLRSYQVKTWLSKQQKDQHIKFTAIVVYEPYVDCKESTSNDKDKDCKNESGSQDDISQNDDDKEN